MNLILRVWEQEPFYFGYVISDLCSEEGLLSSKALLKISEPEFVLCVSSAGGKNVLQKLHSVVHKNAY